MNKKNLLKKEYIWQLAIAIFLIIIGVVCRLFPHPPNFTPIVAIAIFGGVYLSSKTALLLPIIIMIISDIFIGFYDFNLMIFVYVSILLSVILGFLIRKNKNWIIVLSTSVLSAFLFFIITNFAVWFFTTWYPKNLFGIVQCYLMALPFLKNNILGNLFYTGIIFGFFEIAKVFGQKFFRAKIFQRLKYDLFSNC
jgi:hypothetical protein